MLNNNMTDNTYQVDQGEGVSSINAGSRGAIVNIASVSSYIAQVTREVYVMRMVAV